MTRRNKIYLSILVSIFTIIGGLYLAIFHLGLLEYIVNRELKNLVGDKFPAQVYIGEIKGNFFSSLILRDITVTYNDGRDSCDIARIRELITEYSSMDIIGGRLIFKSVFIDSAEITIKKSDQKIWLIPKPLKKSEQKERTIDFEIQELGLNNLKLNLVFPGDSLIFSDIILRAHIEGREKTYAVDIDALSYRSSESKFNLNSASGKATLMGNNLIFQDVFAVTDSSNIEIGGQVLFDKEPYVKLFFNAGRLDIGELCSITGGRLRGNIEAKAGLELKNGIISGNISLSGTFMDRNFDSLYTVFSFNDNMLILDTINGCILDGCYLDGKGGIDFRVKPSEYNLMSQIKGFNLNNLVFNTFETNFNGFLNMNGRGFGKKEMALNIDVDFDETFFDEYHAHSVKGRVLVTTDSIIFYDVFSFCYYDNMFIASGRLEYSGDINMSGSAVFDDLSVFNNKIFIKEMGGRGKFDGSITGPLKNPHLTGSCNSDSLWIYGIYASSVTADLDIRHFLFNREGYLKYELINGTAYDIPFDTIHTFMKIDTHNVSITKADFCNAYVTGEIRGNLDYISYPQILTIDSIGFDLFGLSSKNDEKIEIAIDSAGYEFAHFQLSQPVGYVGCAGRVNYDETLDLSISGEEIDISPWIDILVKEYNFSGRLSGLTTIRGDFQSPLIDFHGGIDSLGYEELILGDLFVDFDYANERIEIDSISIDSYTGFYEASGYLPINLSFREIDNRFPEREQFVEITASDIRFDFISFLLDDVEDMTGDFKAELEITGTLLKPRLDGWATVRNGILKEYDLVFPLEDLNIDLKMTGKTVYLEKATATCKNGRNNNGRIEFGGNIVIHSIDQFNYNIWASAQDFPIKYELGDISTVVDADLNIIGTNPPVVSGNVFIIEAKYRENFAGEEDGWTILSSMKGEDNWNLDITAEFGSNFWIKNDDVDVEVAGRLNLIRESGKYRYYGTVEVVRGKGFLTGRTFRIEPGSYFSYEDIEYPNPRLDIMASTKIRGAPSESSGGGNEPRSYVMRVHITGTLDEPIINAAEGSQFSTEEIIPLIFSDYYKNENETTKDPFEERLVRGLSGFLSAQMNQIGSRTLGVETFEVDPVYGDKLDPLGTKLTLGFYTHPNLYVYGRSAISGGQEVGFEYRMRRFLLVEGRVDDEQLYHLLLNFYWEY